MASSVKAPAEQAISSTWKVSEVLDRYPQLLEVLVAASPAFKHLRNPLMLKTWYPPLSVRIARFQDMKECNPPISRITSSPGLKYRW